MQLHATNKFVVILCVHVYTVKHLPECDVVAKETLKLTAHTCYCKKKALVGAPFPFCVLSVPT